MSAEPVTHTSRTLATSVGQTYLDIYQPGSPAPLLRSERGGILVLAGVGDNRQVPQLVNLLHTFAQTGMVVMNVTAPSLMNYDLSTSDTEAVVQAVQTFEQLPGMTGKPVGILSFSGGAPIACFVAADARVRDHISFVTLFGGYFQTVDVLRAFGQRAIALDGHTVPWNPDPVPLQTLTNVLTPALPSSDQTSIQDAIVNGAEPLSTSQLASLSPAGRAVYHLLQGDDPRHVDATIAALPLEAKQLLLALSPARVINQIHAPIFLLHDHTDRSLPVTGSRDFAAALARLHHPYDYVELHVFDHVQVRSHLDFAQTLGDGSHLFAIIDQLYLLSTRD
jgi:hypothetical protein